MQASTRSRARPSSTRWRSFEWKALLRLALAALVVLALGTPTLAQATVRSAGKGPTLSAQLDAKKAVAKLDSRQGLRASATPTPRVAPLPPTRWCDAPALARRASVGPHTLREPSLSREQPHQLRRIPRMNRGEPPRA